MAPERWWHVAPTCTCTGRPTRPVRGREAHTSGPSAASATAAVLSPVLDCERAVGPHVATASEALDESQLMREGFSNVL